MIWVNFIVNSSTEQIHLTQSHKQWRIQRGRIFRHHSYLIYGWNLQHSYDSYTAKVPRDYWHQSWLTITIVPEPQHVWKYIAWREATIKSHHPCIAQEMPPTVSHCTVLGSTKVHTRRFLTQLRSTSMQGTIYRQVWASRRTSTHTLLWLVRPHIAHCAPIISSHDIITSPSSPPLPTPSFLHCCHRIGPGLPIPG